MQATMKSVTKPVRSRYHALLTLALLFFTTLLTTTHTTEAQAVNFVGNVAWTGAQNWHDTLGGAMSEPTFTGPCGQSTIGWQQDPNNPSYY